MKIAMQSRLDIVSLPSHTSHALQPLDLVCFAPFKIAFRKQRDTWTLVINNKNIGKQELCQWTSKALQSAFISKKIKVGFSKAGIWPLDCHVARQAKRPSAGFKEGGECERGRLFAKSGAVSRRT